MAAEELVAEKADGFEALSEQLISLAPRYFQLLRPIREISSSGSLFQVERHRTCRGQPIATTARRCNKIARLGLAGVGVGSMDGPGDHICTRGTTGFGNGGQVAGAA